MAERASLTLVASDREEREDWCPIVGHTAHTQVSDVFKRQGGAVDGMEVIQSSLHFIIQTHVYFVNMAPHSRRFIHLL